MGKWDEGGTNKNRENIKKWRKQASTSSSTHWIIIKIVLSPLTLLSSTAVNWLIMLFSYWLMMLFLFLFIFGDKARQDGVKVDLKRWRRNDETKHKFTFLPWLLLNILSKDRWMEIDIGEIVAGSQIWNITHLNRDNFVIELLWNCE